MNAIGCPLGELELAGFRCVGWDAGHPDEPTIRARVRAALKAHGRLMGETWDHQAEHAEKAVSEVIRGQGLDAGRRWAEALEDELSAERHEPESVDPALVAAIRADSEG
jgi:hypothetical protein